MFHGEVTAPRGDPKGRCRRATGCDSAYETGGRSVTQGRSTVTASFDTNDVMHATFSQKVIDGADSRNDERG
ncbi:MAG: hypothetical protein DWI69_03250 [Chloroflexi bacterium]|nr:MAG: hypothetical protein DWI60_00410 [Chloroflexota bacterium]RLT56359.1 MAG: hypothetical protein DWI69_03250 [Chloroflexota bacterium]